ncbi:MAG: tryptophan permease [Saprospiraceae bacterium]|nr:aromatic amino acid transporter [Bacteroidia bacterium]NNE14599.1 tryptophan permease [Saprospiraceae bacterium]NNL92502.1 tryptophan permease [Saprospiraceae bacterium]
MDIKNKSIVIGTMITSGSAIGAGMFTLPIISSGMWFPLAFISMLLIWLVSYLSSLMILEICLEYPSGSSFNTFVSDILGKTWSVVMGLSVCFMLYILLYAYFSAFGNMAVHTFGLVETKSNVWLQGGLGLSLGLLLAVAVWISTFFVGRISIVLVVAMVISFVIAMSGGISNISMTILFDQNTKSANYFSYLWIGLPYFITSFGFSSVVPSLYKYYGKDSFKIKNSLFYGSLIALITYLVWIATSFGIIPRFEFTAINEAGGNMGDLVSVLEQKIGNSAIQSALVFFSNFAIISSFLGVGLSLFDYLADRFNFDGSNKGRFYTAAITFLPPGIASFFYPDGFIAAIGFAGLFLFIAFFLIPFLMIWTKRSKVFSSHYRMSGGKALLIFVLIVSTTTAVCHVLGMINYLPRF